MERQTGRDDAAYFITNSLTMMRAGIGTAIAASSALGSNEHIPTLLIIGVATDVIDGRIGHLFNGKSPEGPWRDSLADIILFTSAIGYLSHTQMISPEASIMLLGMSTIALFIRSLKYSIPNDSNSSLPKPE